jgi:hypothetical protein
LLGEQRAADVKRSNHLVGSTQIPDWLSDLPHTTPKLLFLLTIAKVYDGFQRGATRACPGNPNTGYGTGSATILSAKISVRALVSTLTSSSVERPKQEMRPCWLTVKPDGHQSCSHRGLVIGTMSRAVVLLGPWLETFGAAAQSGRIF